MPLEQLLRQQIHSATETVPGGPDLAVSLRAGRRRRRLRTTASVIGAAAVIAAVGATATRIVVPETDGPSVIGTDEFVSNEGLNYPDLVAGTDFDTTLQERIGASIPSIAAANDIYPSEGTTGERLTVADRASATDWTAYYENVGASEHLELTAGYELAATPARTSCEGLEVDGSGAAPSCTATPIGEGVAISNAYSVPIRGAEVSSGYTYVTSYQTPDGFAVKATDTVVAPSWQAANAIRTLDNVSLTQLVTDPKLRFPAPDDQPE